MASNRDRRPSEYGGTPGRVQDGIGDIRHELTAEEEARLMRATEPTDPTDDTVGALARERRMEGRA